MYLAPIVTTIISKSPKHLRLIAQKQQSFLLQSTRLYKFSQSIYGRLKFTNNFQLSITKPITTNKRPKISKTTGMTVKDRYNFFDTEEGKFMLVSNHKTGMQMFDASGEILEQKQFLRMFHSFSVCYQHVEKYLSLWEEKILTLLITQNESEKFF